MTSSLFEKYYNILFEQGVTNLLYHYTYYGSQFHGHYRFSGNRQEDSAVFTVAASQGQSGCGIHADSKRSSRRFRHRMGNALCRLDRICDLRGTDRAAATAIKN